MNHTPFTLGDVPNVHERGYLEAAHRNYHVSGETISSSETARNMGQLLLRSPVLDHQIDGAWLFVDAALGCQDDTDSNTMFTRSVAAFSAAEEFGEPKEKLIAQLGQAYLPAYIELRHGREIDLGALTNRVVSLNQTILEASTKFESKNGRANEIAVLSLLLLNSYRTGSQAIAWPSRPYENMHYGVSYNEPNKNFDIGFGRLGSPPSAKIQVKSFLDQPSNPLTLETTDGDQLLQSWQDMYSPDITTIFSDAHLRNTHTNPYFITWALADPYWPHRETSITIATNNILDELATTTERMRTVDLRSASVEHSYAGGRGGT